VGEGRVGGGRGGTSRDKGERIGVEEER